MWGIQPIVTFFSRAGMFARSCGSALRHGAWISSLLRSSTVSLQVVSLCLGCQRIQDSPLFSLRHRSVRGKWLRREKQRGTCEPFRTSRKGRRDFLKRFALLEKCEAVGYRRRYSYQTDLAAHMRKTRKEARGVGRYRGTGPDGRLTFLSARGLESDIAPSRPNRSRKKFKLRIHLNWCPKRCLTQSHFRHLSSNSTLFNFSHCPLFLTPYSSRSSIFSYRMSHTVLCPHQNRSWHLGARCRCHNDNHRDKYHIECHNVITVRGPVAYWNS